MTNELKNVPYFASRLNSMGERLDLWSGENNVLGWIARQGEIKGLNLVDFNSPQHLEGLTTKEVTSALENASLGTGAVCTRFPQEFERGAFTNPEPSKRRAAIDLVLDAGKCAQDLGARELVIWSAFDGYDYSLQADYQVMWNQCIEAFRTVCDSFPDLKVSLEPKPTEPCRFFIHNTTGTAMLMVRKIDRENMGLTLDFGHCLMATENPGQSAALLGQEGKLFGVQLNDGFVNQAGR
jgi:Predicted sugar isomerase